MRKFAFYLSLFAVMGFLAAPVWAGPSALSDSEMDGVFAQGIVIQNNFSDDDSFSNTQVQGNWSTGANSQQTDPTSGAANTNDAAGGDAYDATARANGGDAGSIALGGAWGGDAENAANANATGGNATDGEIGDSFDTNTITGGAGTATSTGGDSDGGTGVAVPVALASGGDGDAEAENEGGEGENEALAAALSLGLNLGVNYFENENEAESIQVDLTFNDQDIELDEVAMASDYSIAYHGVDGEYLQSQTNGPNSFNNSQNQLWGEVSNDAPVVITDVNNAAMAGTWAAGYADSAPADQD